MKGNRVYADNAATTRPFPEAILAAKAALEDYYNPSAIYENAGRARRILSSSRALIAELVGAEEDEIFFTSGGSESNNLALFGAAAALPPEKRHIVAGEIEHSSILEPLKRLEKEGFRVTLLKPDARGGYDPEEILRALPEDTGIFTLMTAQNEVGTVEPVEEIGPALRERGIFFHTDAVQSVGHLETGVKKSGVSSLSASAHKFGGIKGAGFLFLRRGTPFLPPFSGGGQEKGLRPGTENVPGIAAMAAALSRAEKTRESEEKRLWEYQKRLDKAILSLPGARKTGEGERRLPGLLSYYFEGIDSEALVHALDLFGVDAAAGAACRGGKREENPVLRALGLSGGGALRLSLGWDTGEEDIRLLEEKIPRAVRLLRET